MEAQKMTTEQFHELLRQNTEMQNRLRSDYAKAKKAIQSEYEERIIAIEGMEDDAVNEHRMAREAFEQSKREYDRITRELARQRHEAGHKKNLEEAETKNQYAWENERIQNERHLLFEQFGKREGYIPEGLLHPSWTRTKKEEKGGDHAE